MSEKNLDFIGTRHSIKPKSEDIESGYKGISEKGEQLARERANDILKIVEESEDGTVMFIGGASDQVRTRSTAEVYGEEMKKIVMEEDKNIVILDKKDIADDKKGYSQIVSELSENIKNDPEKKFVIDFPMFLKEFSLGDGKFVNKDGSLTGFAQKLLEIGKTEEGALDIWIESGGTIEGISGPSPEDIAKDHLSGVRRLLDFAKRTVGEDRPIKIGFVGHSWSLDVLAIYLANGGKITKDGFDKVGGSMIEETQPIEFVSKGDAAVMKYKGKEFSL